MLVKLDGADLEIHYRHSLEELSNCPGMLGVIFRKAQNKIRAPSCVVWYFKPHLPMGQPLTHTRC